MTISIKSSGDFKNTAKFLGAMQDQAMYKVLEPYARAGVDALSSATPTETGKTAASWGYEITIEQGHCRIDWTNDNINQNVNIAVILQYGHGTRNGGYVEGRDYINPVMDSVFSQLADEMWSAVQKA